MNFEEVETYLIEQKDKNSIEACNLTQEITSLFLNPSIDDVNNYLENRAVKRKDLPMYNNWMGMINRCYYPKHDSYLRYGGRGIAVCDRWLGNNGKYSIDGYHRFMHDMGMPPEGMKKPTIDRIDPDKGYYKRNCQWLSQSENSKKARKSYTFSKESIGKPVKIIEVNHGTRPESNTELLATKVTPLLKRELLRQADEIGMPVSTLLRAILIQYLKI